MDFQEAFLVVFWPAWSRMLGLFVAGTIITGIYHILTRSLYIPKPRPYARMPGLDRRSNLP